MNAVPLASSWLGQFLVSAVSAARTRIVGALGLGAWVFSARLGLIRAGGSAVPFWDQWGAEAISLYRPWLNGTLQWREIIAAHNEHRIALTRLADLALFTIAGGWNPWLQLVFNAALHSFVAVGLLALFWPALIPSARAIFAIVIAVVFAAPAGWQNALWGFQSQVLFGSLLTVSSIAGICTGKPLSLRWWLGWIAAALALWANAGGWLVSITLLIISIGRILACETTARARLGILLLLLIVIAGGMLNVRAPHHASLQVHSARQLIAVVMQGLAWPWLNHPWMAGLMQSPLLVLGLRAVRRKTSLSSREWCAVALWLYVIFHICAVAYSRGAGLPDDRPLSRYQDPLLLGVIAQIFAGLLLARQLGIVGRISFILWLTVLVSGLLLLTEVNLTLNLPYKRAHDAASLANIRDYVATGDSAKLHRTYGLVELPENPEVMHQVLDQPDLRSVLPPALFAPDPDAAFRPPAVISIWPRLIGITSIVLLLILVAQLTQRRAPEA